MLVMIFIALPVSSAFAATVGSSLNAPETGWKRIENNSPLFVYDVNKLAQHSGSGAYSGSNVLYSTPNWAPVTSQISFSFKGTKLRLLLATPSVTVSGNTITIDGVTSNIHNFTGPSYSMLAFSKEGMDDKEHQVTININNSPFGFDAIDIDENGYLVDTSLVRNLQAESGDSKVTLNWSTVIGATGYNVKRSTKPGGPYTTVANNVYGTTYTDTTVTNGTTYYYVVTAIKSGAAESGNSNEASGTPQAPATNQNRALLVITLVSGLEKEYDLPITEVNNFVTWYNDRAAGIGKEVYTINKEFNKANFLTRKDFIAFDKIETFEINEYTPVTK